MAAVDADVEMYESAVTFIQGILVVHGLQLRVVQNKDVHALKIPVFAEKSVFLTTLVMRADKFFPVIICIVGRTMPTQSLRSTPASSGMGRPASAAEGIMR